VPVGMKPSKSGSFLRKKGIEAIEVFEARKIINEFFRVNQVIALNNVMTNTYHFILMCKKNGGRIIKYQAEF
jgi:hypothetical protein